MRDVQVLEDFAPPFPGGPRLRTNDIQCLVFQPGDPPPFNEPGAVGFVNQPKGLAQIAYERGLWKGGLVKIDGDDHQRSLVHILGECLDFQQRIQSILEEHIQSRGHICDFLPKFHCELNPIERVWSHSKRFVRNHSDETRATLKKNIPRSLLPCRISPLTMRKYYDHSFEYASQYNQGKGALVAKMAVKKRSHRAVPPSEADL